MIFWACTNYFNAVTLKINTNFKEVGLKFSRHDCKQFLQSLCPFILYNTRLKKWCFNTKLGSEKRMPFFVDVVWTLGLCPWETGSSYHLGPRGSLGIKHRRCLRRLCLRRLWLCHFFFLFSLFFLSFPSLSRAQFSNTKMLASAQAMVTLPDTIVDFRSAVAP